MADSTQHKIDRNRPPRVQITYDVETGGAIEKVEIPFVVGIMADLSGVGSADRYDGVPLKDKARGFVEIDRDNFGEVMAKIAPGLTVQGALDDQGQLDADGVLTFKSLDDFNPASLVKRIKGLKDLYTQRSALRDILTKIDSNDELHAKLKIAVAQDSIKQIGSDATAQLAKLEPPADGKDKGK
ncbi:type VI secretion system contractile sheath small subunit [Sphingomonas sp. R-74633]|uniref:type VI secretion system contractile sheath small subunit n=1 Tax=Sphingomonas sp. R-74633 TaxID=2751188 RepID=UPI0015D38947|nr:type VI secretion system contractile sheath small subunit [Sphingomonas sp. R-74633]NYT43203.1 type VI secretion system contractile sheath small subunit [Sphingomonas sp. R-74633]